MGKSLMLKHSLPVIELSFIILLSTVLQQTTDAVVHTICVTLIVPQLESNMTELCVIHAISSLSMVSGGSVLNAQTMTCAQFAIIVISTILGIGFTESQPLVLKGTPALKFFVH